MDLTIRDTMLFAQDHAETSDTEERLYGKFAH
jgi:hypothetical protein